MVACVASDRCVVMVGLPFANRSDEELRERMRYASSRSRLDGKERDSLSRATADSNPVVVDLSEKSLTAASDAELLDHRRGRDPGEWYYESLCLRAGNSASGSACRNAAMTQRTCSSRAPHQ